MVSEESVVHPVADCKVSNTRTQQQYNACQDAPACCEEGTNPSRMNQLLRFRKPRCP